MSEDVEITVRIRHENLSKLLTRSSADYDGAELGLVPLPDGAYRLWGRANLWPGSVETAPPWDVVPEYQRPATRATYTATITVNQLEGILKKKPWWRFW